MAACPKPAAAAEVTAPFRGFLLSIWALEDVPHSVFPFLLPSPYPPFPLQCASVFPFKKSGEEEVELGLPSSSLTIRSRITLVQLLFTLCFLFTPFPIWGASL